MKSVFSWFITALAIMFWIFRVVVTILATFEVDFIVVPSNINTEITLLFLTLPCLLMIIKRNIIGGIVYFGLYGWYFGSELATILENIFVNNLEIIPASVATSAMVCIAAVLISLLNLLDIIFAKHRKSENPNKKVDWFYKNEKYDRELDERRDKNNYRIY